MSNPSDTFEYMYTLILMALMKRFQQMANYCCITNHLSCLKQMVLHAKNNTLNYMVITKTRTKRFKDKLYKSDINLIIFKDMQNAECF